MTLKWMAVVIATVSLTLGVTGNVVTLAVNGGQLPCSSTSSRSPAPAPR